MLERRAARDALGQSKEGGLREMGGACSQQPGLPGPKNPNDYPTPTQPP